MSPCFSRTIGLYGLGLGAIDSRWIYMYSGSYQPQKGISTHISAYKDNHYILVLRHKYSRATASIRHLSCNFSTSSRLFSLLVHAWFLASPLGPCRSILSKRKRSAATRTFSSHAC